MGTKEESSFEGVFARELAAYCDPATWKAAIRKSDIRLCKRSAEHDNWPGKTTRPSFGSDLAEDENFIEMFYMQAQDRRDFEPHEKKVVKKLVTSAKSIVTGMSSIAQAHRLLKAAEVERKNYTGGLRKFQKFAGNCMAFQEHSSKLPRNQLMAAVSKLPVPMQQRLEASYAVMETVLGLVLWGGTNRVKELLELVDLAPDIRLCSMVSDEGGPFESENLLPFRFGHALVLFEVETATLVWVDGQSTQKLIQLSRSVFAAELYAAYFNRGSSTTIPELWAPATAMIDMLLDSFHAADHWWANRVCQAYKKLWDVYLSMLAGRLSDKATRELLAEWDKDGFGAVVDRKAALGLLTTLRPRIAAEVGRLFKVLPAPCYDVAACWYDALEKMSVPNPGPGLAADAKRDKPNLKDARRIMKMLWLQGRRDQMANSEIKTMGVKGVGRYVGRGAPPQWFREYKAKFVLPRDLALYDDIDISGDQTYIFTQPDDLSAFKSKSTTEDTVEEALGDEDPIYLRRNLITRATKDPTMPSPAGCLSGVATRQHPHRVGFKNEIHKPFSRLFYQAAPADRFALSEFEQNVGRVCKIVPGYEIGSDPAEQLQRLVYQITPDHDPRGASKMYYFNFDISKWSPRMRAEWQDAIYDFFAMLFDLPELGQLRTIHTQAIVVLNKLGYRATWNNRHANFDGYDGKAMTFGQCAMIYYSTYLAKQTAWGARIYGLRFVAYIDDGACSLQLPRTDGDRIFMLFCDLVEEVYRQLGFDLSAYKCSISDRLQVFLNELYLGGMPIKYGMRAALQLGAKAKDRHFGLQSELAKLAATTRGVAKAGSDTYTCGMMYYIYCGMTLHRWDREVPIANPFYALTALAPSGRGGWGLVNLNSLGSNLTSQPLSEGIALLLSVARNYPAYRMFVVKLLRQPVYVKTPLQAVLSPRQVIDEAPQVSAVRLRMAIARKLNELAVAPVLKGILAQMSPGTLLSLAGVLDVPGNTYSARVLDKMMASTPMFFAISLSRKFDTSSVLVPFLGYKKLKEIGDANSREVIARNRYLMRFIGSNAQVLVFA